MFDIPLGGISLVKVFKYWLGFPVLCQECPDSGQALAV